MSGGCGKNTGIQDQTQRGRLRGGPIFAKTWAQRFPFLTAGGSEAEGGSGCGPEPSALSVKMRLDRTQDTSAMAALSCEDSSSASVHLMDHQQRVMMTMKRPSFPPIRILSHEQPGNASLGKGQTPTSLQSGCRAVHHAIQDTPYSESDAIGGTLLNSR